MQNLGATIGITALSVVVTLIITLLFNKLVALPAALKKQKEAHRQEIESMKVEQETLKEDQNQLRTQITELRNVIDALPAYRQQSLTIQQELHEADNALLATCEAIQNSITTLNTSARLLQTSVDALKEGQDCTRSSLDRLEKREKNALRMKIIAEYKLFTSLQKNPTQAWSEMEHHAFFALVHDYEALGGNDYVHSTVLPAMNELEVVLMDDLERLSEVMSARQQ